MVVDVLALGERFDLDPLDLLANEANAGIGQELELALDFRRIRLALEEGIGADGRPVGVAQLRQRGEAKGCAALSNDGPSQETGRDHGKHADTEDGEDGPPMTQAPHQ